MLKNIFPFAKATVSEERKTELLEEYLQNASLSLYVTIKQLQYASSWLHKYQADAIDVDDRFHFFEMLCSILPRAQKAPFLSVEEDNPHRPSEGATAKKPGGF